ncbi:biosynthetic-type acetolactate synthase large subunit [Bariatricus sp. HCP28S3_A7]|uniref:biosynthetic-type acetolactate synthase large subunit n=1 Tax=Bariatricus sp. HCP28S3_A7 TaxID=3438894 RepID=UPI003F8AFCA9
MKKISGNKLLVKALKEEGVEVMFGYPGACTIDISDELYKQNHTKVILPRHEQALVHAADAYARSTGKVGVCLVTSGPGATNLVTGLATANYDSVPLVCFTGQVARALIGNDAFQEVDIVGITRSITKYGVTVSRREDLGRIIKEAFYIARTGRPGPVLVDLPKDVMAELGSPEYPQTVNIRGYKPSTGVHIGQLKRAIKMLGKAKRPLLLAGGGVNISGANACFRKLAEITNVPVVTTIMGRGAIPTDHPLFIGNLGMHGSYASNMAVGECDLLFSIGTRFNDRITGKLHAFAPNAQIVHIDIDTASISRNIKVDVPIVADAKEAIEKLLEYVEPGDNAAWLERIGEWKQEHPLKMKPKYGVMQAQDIIETINEVFKEDDTIVVTDVGQHQMFTSQYLEVNEKTRMYMSGGLGTMGYGLPGAVGAQIGNPDSTVIAISGDGGMQMNIQEFATAVLEELPLILCVFNNTYLGMVRQWQKLFYGKRYSMTDLRSGAATRRGEEPPVKYTPDFVKLAESYGAKGIRVTCPEEMKPAFEEAKRNRALKVPTLIEFILDPEDQVYPMVQPGGTLEEMILDN